MAPPHTSPQKNSRISTAAHNRIPTSRSAQRISKPKQNRGRPSKYAEACIKKLLLLRACGLTNLEIIALVGGRISERTIQDFAKQYLGEPGERYGGPSEDDARSQTSILKKLLKKSNDERTSKLRREALTKTSIHDPGPTNAEGLQLEESNDVETAQLGQVDPIPSTSRTKRLSMTCTRVGDNLRHSISSSFLRAIDRFSRSSLGSASTATTFDLDHTPPQHTTAKLISERTKYLTDAQNALNAMCCGNWSEAKTFDSSTPPMCLHIRILTLIETDVEDTYELWERLYQELYAEILSRESFSTGNNADLFFVTRVGAPLRAVEAFIARADNIKARNEDEQNFVFFLNAQTFKHATCTCQGITSDTAHSSPFVCLIQTLERYNFDFEHVDHNGRSFLSYLLAFVADPNHWITELLCIGNIWRDRLARMSEQNDSCGICLADYIYDENPYLTTLQTPLGRTSLQSFMTPGWSDTKDGYLRTQLQQYIRTGFLRTEADSPLPFAFSEIKASINHYSTDGRTPLMEFLVETMESNMASSVICRKLDVLLENGANPYARSSGGQTALHFAAGKARAKVIAYLLLKGIQKDHRDDFGRTAYDYAWNLFNKSRKRDVKALQSARAFQALIVLDEDRKRGSARSNIHRRSGDICRMLNAPAMIAEDLAASGFL